MIFWTSENGKTAPWAKASHRAFNPGMIGNKSDPVSPISGGLAKARLPTFLFFRKAWLKLSILLSFVQLDKPTGKRTSYRRPLIRYGVSLTGWVLTNADTSAKLCTNADTNDWESR